MEDSTLLDISTGLSIYYSIFLIVVGTVCNILSIIILSRKSYRGTTFSIYFRFLAAMDLFTLYSGLTRHLIYGAFDVRTRHINEIYCKIHHWTTASSPDISAWVLVAVTTERVMSIIMPFAVHELFTRRNVCIVLFVLSSVILITNTPMLVNFGDKIVVGANNTTTVEKCTMNRPEMQYFMDNGWYWIDLIKFVLLPSFILSLLNTVIIVSVIRSRRRVEKFISAPSHRPNYEKASRALVPQKELSLTITLLVVNITFIILNSPISIYLIGREYWFPPGFKPTERLVYTSCIMAMYTNNAANFLLYCASGGKFRSELYIMFQQCVSKSGIKSKTQATTNTPPINRMQVHTVTSSIQE